MSCLSHAIARKQHANIRWAFCVTLVLLLGIIISAPAHAQNDKKAEGQLRIVHGSVVDKDENPVASSIVYLVNVKTQAIRTYVADDAGNYRFSGLDPNVDYNLHAERNDLTSATRTISSFDSSRDLEIILKLSHKRKGR
ncbi:MAG TPA: carboxypeptidase-like regulatory domain-containing protein [Candidatus Acidoferrales bacterium]|nr:carboxypeptidase-like regulatory domain-containing protein [Candidatus Acidoferrales bacterium]